MRALAVVCAAGAVAAMWARPRRITLRLPSGSGIAAAFGGFAAGWTVASAAGLPGTAALVAGTLAAGVPGAMRRRTRDRELRREALRWPDFLAAVRSRLATGSAIPTACADAARHIGGRFLDLAAPSGVSFADTTASVRARWADPLTDRILTTLELAATVGGSHVGAVLGALTTSVNEDLRLRRAHDAALTEQRLTAGVALFAPWVILALSIATNPAASEAFSTRTGNLILAGGFAATGVGYALARRSARLSRPPRLFA
ncbi:MAG: hypothetical protein AAB198_04095 [Actinomycetota bacterium]